MGSDLFGNHGTEIIKRWLRYGPNFAEGDSVQIDQDRRSNQQNNGSPIRPTFTAFSK